MHLMPHSRCTALFTPVLFTLCTLALACTNPHQENPATGPDSGVVLRAMAGGGEKARAPQGGDTQGTDGGSAGTGGKVSSTGGHVLDTGGAGEAPLQTGGEVLPSTGGSTDPVASGGGTQADSSGGSDDPVTVSGGTTSPAPTGGTPAAAPAEHRLVFSSAPVNPLSEPGSNTFALTSLRELLVYSVWNGLTGMHVERRRFIAPNGDAYYEKLIAFSTDISVAIPYEPIVSIPHSAVVMPVSTDQDGKFQVLDYLGVAGTWISQHSLTGTWRLEVFLDSSATPITSSEFTLN